MPDGGVRRNISSLDLEFIEAELDNGLHYLVENAPEIGAAYGRLVRANNRVDQVEASEMRLSDEKSADMRKASARASLNYDRACEEQAQASEAWERMKTRRMTVEILSDIWRTLQATNRTGRV